MRFVPLYWRLSAPKDFSSSLGLLKPSHVNRGWLFLFTPHVTIVAALEAIAWPLSHHPIEAQLILESSSQSELLTCSC